MDEDGKDCLVKAGPAGFEYLQEDEGSTACLGNLLQCLVTCEVKIKLKKVYA